MLVARGDISRFDVVRMLRTELNAVRATGLFSFTQPHIYSHSGDAARIGKPALDLYFSTVWDHRAKFSFEYPPAVCICSFSILADCFSFDFGALRRFASFCVLLRPFAPFCVVLRRFDFSILP
jgi:hypothetical protein